MPAKRRPASDHDVEALKDRLARACRVLYHRNLLKTVGHVSLRIPNTETFLLGLNRFTGGRTEAKDVFTYSFAGEKVDGPDLPLAREIYIHTEALIARPDIASVIHVHMPYALAFGVAGRPILPLYIQAAEVVQFGVSVVDSPLMVTTVDRGQAVARGLTDGWACHMRGHGQVIVGRTVEHAALMTAQLEEQAQCNFRALQLNPSPQPCATSEIEEWIHENRRTPETVTISPFSTLWEESKERRMGPLSLFELEMEADSARSSGGGR